MKKFIPKVLLLVAAVICITGGIIQLCIYFWPGLFLSASGDYVLCNYQYSRINKKSSFKNIVIGDSRGMSGVDPRSIGNGKTWTNLCVPGSDFFEGYTTLKHYLAEGNTIDSVILVYGLDYMEGSTKYFDVRTVPYKYPTPAEMAALDSVEKVYSTEIHTTQSTDKATLALHQFERRLRYNHFAFSYRETFLDCVKSIISAGFKNNKARKTAIMNHIAATSGQLTIGLADSCGDNFFNNPLYVANVNTHTYRFNTISAVYFNLLMQLIAEKHIKAAMYIAPLNEASWRLYQNSYYQKTFNAYVAQLNVKYPQLQLITGPGYLPNKYFGDVYHVNEKGLQPFTQQFLEALKGAKFLK